MTKTLPLLALLFLLGPAYSWGQELDSCRHVGMADVGWTDVSATTALTKKILGIIGYDVKVDVLSIPVTFSALKNKDIDIFLGNWMPSQEADIRPYLKDGSVVKINRNLSGAVYTLAVPDYVYEQGLKSFSDLARFGDQFHHKIYGIEAGNDGNRHILDMIRDDAFGLKDWQLVESSEQGMLTAARDAFSQKQSIVFLAWAPHPMNLKLSLKYLSGGDEYFGENLGASEVITVSRRNFSEDCPNLAQFFRNLVFTVPMENQIMNSILNEHLSLEDAAERWLFANQEQVFTWLKEVKTWDKGLASDALRQFLSSAKEAKKHQLSIEKAPLGAWMERAIGLLNSNFAVSFKSFSQRLQMVVEKMVGFILYWHWGLVIGFFSLMAYLVHRSIKLSLWIVLGLLLIVNLGLWEETIQTLVLVMLASLICIVLGVPLGIGAARNRWFFSLLRPVLDLMQTIPTFVYLIPTLMLFGLGIVPGLISTVIFAIAAPIRLTCLGIKNVPADLLEASRAFGATSLQTLWKIEIPHALPAIMNGFTQCIMLSLSMVVVSALVGAEGLGTPVVRALNTVNIKLGFESGIAIVIVAILLDRSITIKNRC